jgi:hypothetical protein
MARLKGRLVDLETHVAGLQIHKADLGSCLADLETRMAGLQIRMAELESNLAELEKCHTGRIWKCAW